MTTRGAETLTRTARTKINERRPRGGRGGRDSTAKEADASSINHPRFRTKPAPPVVTCDALPLAVNKRAEQACSARKVGHTRASLSPPTTLLLHQPHGSHHRGPTFLIANISNPSTGGGAVQDPYGGSHVSLAAHNTMQPRENESMSSCHRFGSPSTSNKRHCKHPSAPSILLAEHRRWRRKSSTRFKNPDGSWIRHEQRLTPLTPPSPSRKKTQNKLYSKKQYLIKIVNKKECSFLHLCSSSSPSTSSPEWCPQKIGDKVSHDGRVIDRSIDHPSPPRARSAHKSSVASR